MFHPRLLIGLNLALACATTTIARADTAEVQARAAAERLPGFAKAVGSALRADGDHQFVLASPKRDVAASLFSVDDRWYGAIAHLAPAALQPRMLDARFETVIGSPSFSHLAVVVAEQTGDVPIAKLPARLALSPYAIGSAVHLEQGVNVFATATPGTRGMLGRMSTDLGFTGPIRIQGTVAASVAGELLGTGPAAGGATSLAVMFPSFRPQPFRDLADASTFAVEVRDLTLAVREVSRDLEVTGTHHTIVTISGAATTITGTLAVTRRAGPTPTYDVEMTGKVQLARGPSLAGFTLTAIGVEARFDGAGKSTSLGVVAEVTLPNRRTVSGLIAVKVGGPTRRPQLEEVSLALSGTLTLSDLSINVPAAREIALTNPSLGLRVASREGFIGGTLEWRSRGISTTGVVYLKGGPRPAAAVFARLRATKLSALVRGLPSVADMALPEAVMILSTAKLADLPIASLPSPVQEMLDTISIASSGRVTIADGVTLLTQLGGPLKDAAAKLGITGPIVLAGSIGGVVSGAPSFSLYADLPTFKLPAALGSKFIRPRSVKPRMFVALGKSDLGPELELGLELEMAVRFGKEEPVFAGKVFTTLGAKGASVNFTGKLVGRWNNPFGLTGISFEDVVVGLGLGASASMDVALAGKVVLGKLRYAMTGFTTLQVSAAAGIPVPRALGIDIQGSEAGMLTPLRIADALVGAVVSGPLGDAVPDAALKRSLAAVARAGIANKVAAAIPIDLLELRDFEFYVATPGASHPDLPQLDGMGVKIKGKVFMNGKLLGLTDSALKMPEGLRLDVQIAKLAIGPLSIDNSKLLLIAALPGLGGVQLPSLEISGKASVKPFDVGVQVSLDTSAARFTSSVGLGPLGSATVTATSLGGTVIAPRDFALSVAVNGFDRGFAKQLATAVQAHLASSDNARAIKAADALVKVRAATLARERAAAKRDFDAAGREITKWQKQVDKVNGDIKSTQKALAAAKRNFAKAKAFPPNPGNMARYGAEITALGTKLTALQASLATATISLKAAKGATKVVPVESHPRVVAALSALGAAESARAALTAKQATEAAAGKVAADLVRGVTSGFSIQRVELIDARLSTLVRGQRQQLRLAMTVNKKPLDHTFEIDLRVPWKLDFTGLPARFVALF